MNKLKVTLISLAAIVGILAMTPGYVGASAADQVQTGVNQAGGTDSGNSTTLADRIKTIVNVLLYVLGAIAVIMIVIGAIRYVVSGGDNSAVTGAKNTILYAVVGLIIAILAYAIVNFVVSSFK
jgi:uncharacterized membrane protein